MPATIGVSIMPGAMALSRSPDPAHSGPVAAAADPVGQRQLAGRIGRQRTLLIGDPGRVRLVVVEAGLDELGGDGGWTVVEFED